MTFGIESAFCCKKEILFVFKIIELRFGVDGKVRLQMLRFGAFYLSIVFD
jgi:hypothetical protein